MLVSAMLVSTKDRRETAGCRHRMSSEQRKATIVKAAIRLFAERGFRGTTTRELAAAVGVTEPVLYQHFETKRELYSAIIDTKSKEGQEKFAARLSPFLESDDDRGFFTQLAELILEHYYSDPAFVRLLLFSALERHELAKLFYERQLLCLQTMITGYIRRRIKEKAFSPMDSLVAACAFLGMVTRFGLNAVLFNEKVGKTRRKRVVGGIVTLFLRGITSKESPR